MVTSHVQKKIVELLFAWEGEGRRWGRLEREREEAEKVGGEMKSQGGDVGSWEERVVEIEEEMRLMPSLRGEEGESVGDGGQR